MKAPKAHLDFDRIDSPTRPLDESIQFVANANSRKLKTLVWD